MLNSTNGHLRAGLCMQVPSWQGGVLSAGHGADLSIATSAGEWPMGIEPCRPQDRDWFWPMGVVEWCRPQDRDQFWEVMSRCKAFLYALALLWAVLAITPTLDREVINSPPPPVQDPSFVRTPRMTVTLRTRKTHRGKRNRDTAERKTAKWVETGGLEKVLKKIQSNTRKCHKPTRVTVLSSRVFSRNGNLFTLSKAVPPSPWSGPSRGDIGERISQPRPGPTTNGAR